jgi:hypothetical protein
MNVKPLVSVIIVNHNGKKWLKECLDSIKNQTVKNIEVLLVDNASVDDSIDYLNKFYPWVKIIKSRQNLGFSGGNNLGYKHSVGKYLLLINNDTKFGPDFLKEFLKVFEFSKDVGIAQSKIVLMDKPNILDSCGSYWTDTTFLYYLGNGKKAEAEIYNTPRKIFSIKGASMLIKRELVECIGLFDSDFWSYYEETDLCHRAWIAGYESWYWPYATCYHAIGGTSLKFPNSFVQFHNFKNKLLSFLKNFEKESLFCYIPVFLLLNVLIGFVWLLQGKFRGALSLYRAIWWNTINIKSTLEKRSKIQELRKHSDEDIFTRVKINPLPIYYLHLLNDKLYLYKDLIK